MTLHFLTTLFLTFTLAISEAFIIQSPSNLQTVSTKVLIDIDFLADGTLALAGSDVAQARMLALDAALASPRSEFR